jgi:hypothetical protein
MHKIEPRRARRKNQKYKIQKSEFKLLKCITPQRRKERKENLKNKEFRMQEAMPELS